MTNEPNPDRGLPTDPRGVLMTLRIIWGALLMGQIIFFGVIVFVLWPQHRRTMDEQTLRLLFYVECAMLLTMIPVGFALRSITFRNGRDERGNVRPGAYSTGNILLWAMCEGVSFFGLVGAMLNNAPWPHLIVTIIAVVVQLITFPTGGEMGESKS
jgi:hypothetical protein